MRVCVRKCICIHVLCMCTFICTCICVHVYIYCVCVHACMHVYLCLCISVCEHMHMCIKYICVCVLCVCIYVTRPVGIDHLSAINRRFLSSLHYHYLITIYTTTTKFSITITEFNGLSSSAYRNGMLHSEREILAKI